MSKRMLHCFPVAIAIATALALSGCGGGSNTRTDTGTGMTGGTGGTGMTGDSETLTVPEGLVRSTVPPFFYNDATDDTDDQAAPTLTSGIRRDYDANRSGFANDASIKLLGFPSEDDETFDLEVTYVVGDEEVTVRFTDEDLNDVSSWDKTINGVEYWGWLWGEREESLSFIGGLPGYRLYATGGVRTETTDLPSGTAVYEGGMRGDTHLTNDPSSGRESMTGSLRLTADFDEGALEGRISDIRVRPDNPRVWRDLPDTTYFAIDNGQIVDGQFSASLTGMDSNANAPINETVREYEGGVLGEFYGPDADEVGGVLNASREDRVMAGAFGGVKQ